MEPPVPATGSRPGGEKAEAGPMAGCRDGLSSDQARRRLAENGPNRVDVTSGHRGLRLLLVQFTSPIVLILIAATVVSMVLGDLADGLIILVIIAASGALGFWQEHTAGRAIDTLLARVRVEAEVIRDGREVSVPAEEIVVGDLVVLRVGDIVPADCTVTESRSLLVDEAALTGESFPVEKSSEPVPADGPLPGGTGMLFAGTHVVSGAGTAVVARTGRATKFAALTAGLAARDVTTGFERGMTRFGLLLVRVMVVLVCVIFVVNLVLDRPVVESVLFSLALAVGLTPQLLPAIVAVSLSAGARRMAAEQVIVKRLDAIEDFGAMTVLCTDKTGTLTGGVIRLDGAYGLDGETSAQVLRLARLNAGLQHGFTNPLDQAVLADAPPADPRARLDEVPYDFQRKRLSVLVDEAGMPTLVTKGALAGIMQVCATARAGGRIVPLESVRAAVQRRFAELSSGGYRVLGLATAALPGRSTVGVADETNMTLMGLLAFHDPPKQGAAEAIGELTGLGVSVRLITGDNRLAAEHVAHQVGLTGPALTGADIDPLGDDELAERAAHTQIFAEIDPLHKERVVRALRAAGATVGFLGDGINDAPALHTADVGISVDTAVDVAKQSAVIVLLDKDLGVVADGVRLGRQTFANTLKYVRVTTSANFGNMASMAAAAAFLPFLPLLPRQILLLNFLSDIPATAIAADAVDPEQLRRPSAWNITAIRTFMIAFGVLSSVFDIATFLVLRLGFHAGADLFRTGWFIESTATELAVMLLLRTRRPFFRSRPGRALLISSALVALVTVAVPYTPLAEPLGLVAPPMTVLAALGVLTLLYIAANEIAKRFLPADQ
ncbi:magnesium-translocating P-type ATPase [Streptosporangium sp. NPDC000396]|uniref:magnesium-translocating P-type ATPase n=1 Tax=Streptosporangium sp. NPDC000396 TaxID=3366185 RepID=UPI0036C60020